MNKCPNEIKRMIAFHLLSDDQDDKGIIDIKQLRLTSKVYAKVAAEPLFSTIYLTLEPESFERMREVSASPVYANFVKSLHYEPQAVKEPRAHYQWDTYHNRAAPCLPPVNRLKRRHCNEGKQNAAKYQEELERRGLHSISGLRDHHTRYSNIYATSADHEDACQRQVHRAVFADVMARFTNMNKIEFQVDIRTTEPIRVLPDDSRPSGGLPSANSWNADLRGVMQLKAILLGAHDAGTKLESLKCGKIDWRFFQMPDEDMKKVKLALRHLASLHVEIYAEEDATRCNKVLDKYRLGQFLSAAKRLRSFNIDFDECECTELKYWVDQNTWKFLTTVQLNYVDADEDILIDFLKRHAGTLHDLTLCAVRLVQGNWTSALQRIRDTVQLKRFSTYNSLTSIDPLPEGEYWCVDCHLNPFSFTTPEQMAQDERFVKAVRGYVLYGGDFPLLDRVTYPPGAHH